MYLHCMSPHTKVKCPSIFLASYVHFMKGRSTIYLEKKNKPVYLCHRSLLWSLCFGYNGRLPWLEWLSQEVWTGESAFDIDAFGGTKQTWILIKDEETWWNLKEKKHWHWAIRDSSRKCNFHCASLVTSGKTNQSPNTDSKAKLSTTRKSASRET